MRGGSSGCDLVGPDVLTAICEVNPIRRTAVAGQLDLLEVDEPNQIAEQPDVHDDMGRTSLTARPCHGSGVRVQCGSTSTRLLWQRAVSHRRAKRLEGAVVKMRLPTQPATYR